MLAPAARAQDVTATAEVSTQSVYVGDSIVFQVSVDGARNADTPDLSALDGFQAEFVGGQDQSSSMSWNINGKTSQKTTQRYVMQWRLTPTRVGTLTIPALRVSAGGQAATTQAIRVTARAPGDHPDFKLVIEPEKTAAYVGEPVLVKIVWYLGKGARNAQIGGRDGGDVFDVYPAPDPRPAGAQPDDQRYPQVKLMGRDTFGVLGSGDLDGRQVTTFTQHVIVVPRKPGTIALGPMTAAFDAITGERRRSFFDSPWDDRSMTERVVLASNSLSIEAKPLPVSGRPGDFTGLVGSYAIASSLSAVEAGVGDPIVLTVRVTGQEPMAGVAAPDLSKLAGFATGFKLSPEGWDAKAPNPIKPGERVYSMTIRPQSEGVNELPAIPLAYFDVPSGSYKTASSASIPLKVRAVRNVTVADAVGGVGAGGGQGAGGGGGRPTISGPLQSAATEAGLLANASADESLVPQRLRTLSVAGWSVAGAAVLIPPALIGIAVLAAGRRGRARGGDARALARAVRQARRDIRRATTPAGVRSALACAVAPTAGMSPAAVTAADARAAVPERAAGPIEAALHRCDRAEFGTEPVPIDQLRHDALAALAALTTEVNA